MCTRFYQEIYINSEGHRVEAVACKKAMGNFESESGSGLTDLEPSAAYLAGPRSSGPY